MPDRDEELGAALAGLPIPELPEEFWEDLGLRCGQALREKTSSQLPPAEPARRSWRESGRRGRGPWMWASRVGRFPRLATATTMAVLLVVLASLLPAWLPWEHPSVAASPLSADCGSDGDTRSGRTGTLRGQRLVVATSWQQGELTHFLQVLKGFQQTTGAGIIVSYAKTSRDLANDLNSRVEGNCPPDVAILPQPGLLQDLAGRSELKPLDEETRNLVTKNYAPIWQQWGSFHDTLYGVWFKAATKSRIWYNEALFRQAKVQPPHTWDELMQVAATIRHSGTAPFSVAGAPDAAWTLSDWFENVYLSTAGPDLYDKLAKHQIPWTDPSVKQALKTLAEIFGKPEWLAGTTQGALRTRYEASVNDVFGPAPDAAMVYEGDFVANVISDLSAGERTGSFFDFPEIGGSSPLVVGGDVAVMLTNNEAGRKLLKYLATPAAAAAWARTGGLISPNENLNLSLYPNATRAAAQVVTRGEKLNFDLSDLQPAEFGATQGRGLWEIFREFLQSPQDVDGIAAKLEAAAERAWTVTGRPG